MSAPLIHSDMRPVQDIPQDFTDLLSLHPEESIQFCFYIQHTHWSTVHTVYYLICLIWTISMDQSLWDEWFLEYSVTSKLQSALFSLWQNTAALLSFKVEQMLHVHWGHTLWFSKNTLLQIIFHLFLGMLTTTTTAGAIYKFRSEFGQHITRVTTTRCHYRQ